MDIGYPATPKFDACHVSRKKHDPKNLVSQINFRPISPKCSMPWTLPSVAYHGIHGIHGTILVGAGDLRGSPADYRIHALSLAAPRRHAPTNGGSGRQGWRGASDQAVTRRCEGFRSWEGFCEGKSIYKGLIWRFSSIFGNPHIVNMRLLKWNRGRMLFFGMLNHQCPSNIIVIELKWI